MLLTIVFWMLVTLIIFLILFSPSIRSLWEIIVVWKIFKKETIDLRTKFGEWAIVTGSTDGIGKAYAKELAARNMNLILISRNSEKLEHTKNEMLLINPKIKVRVITADFSKGEDTFNKIRPLLQDISIGILVVTGSTDGIGKAYAKELAARNMNLILISRNSEKLEHTKNEMLLINPKIKVRVITADFSKGEDTFNKIRPLLQDISIGILVNNVGNLYEYPMYLEEVPEKTLWDIININVGATTLMTRLVIGKMQEREQGAIVNISSVSEFTPLPLLTVYAATKAYIKDFSDALRVENSRFGITVQHLSPFFVSTKMIAFSNRLQVPSVFVPDATTYSRSAIISLGRINNTTGYWAHSILKFIILALPVWIRIKIGIFVNKTLREDYFRQKEQQTL